MSLYELDGKTPLIAQNAYVADGARVIGNVTLEARSSVWFNAVLRGDNEPIVIGEETNVQDGAVMHTDPGFPMTIGARVTIGHSAIVHGCTVGEGSLVGMGAIIMNGAKIGRGCLIGANALVPEGKEIPDGSLVLGSPGKVVKQIDDATREGLLKAAQIYVERSHHYREGLVAI